MLKRFLSCFLFAFAWSLHAQTPTLDWNSQFERKSNLPVKATATDSAGNIYITGSMSFATDFDVRTCVGHSLYSAGTTDCYVAKYNAADSLLWCFPIAGTVQTDEGLGIAIDNAGYVYVTGYINGTAAVDFNPSTATFNLTGSGGKDGFVAKFNGNFLPSNPSFFQWAFLIGGTTDDQGQSIDVDNQGNVYVTGYFQGTNIDFNPASGTSYLSSAGMKDIFVARYNGSLQPSNASFFITASRIGGTQDDIGNCVLTNGNGHIFLTGYVTGNNVDLDPSANSNLISAGGPLGTAIYFLKYDMNQPASSTSYYEWGFSYCGGSTGTDIALDDSGYVYLTGTVPGGSIDFDPSSNVNNVNSFSSASVFLAKYNASLAASNTGFYQWAFACGYSGGTQANGLSVTTDPNNGVYITGALVYTVDLDPSSNTNTLVNNSGSTYYWIARYNRNLVPSSTSFYQWSQLFINEPAYSIDYGNRLVWSTSNSLRTFNISGTLLREWNLQTTDGWPQMQRMATDRNGNIYICGYLIGEDDFDPGVCTSDLIQSPWANDMFLAMYDSSGTLIWNFAITEPGFNYGSVTDIAVDTNGFLYAVGYFRGTVDFDPSAAVNNLTTGASTSPFMFAVKYNVNQLPSSTTFFQWAFNVGIGGGSTTRLNLGADQKLYVAGVFNLTNVDFDPSPATNAISTSGNWDVFMAKYNLQLTPSAVGFCEWACAVGSSAGDGIECIKSDTSGNVYIGGAFNSTAFDFDPSANANMLSSGANQSGYIAKYNGNLQPSSASFYQWATAIGGSSSADIVNDMIVNDSGYVTVAGNYASTVDFDPSSNTNNIVGPSFGSDGFVVRYNGNLQPSNTAFFKWCFAYMSTSCSARKIIADEDGNIYVAGGELYMEVDPTPAPGYLGSYGSADDFIAKYNTAFLPSNSAFFSWGFHVGTTQPDGTFDFLLTPDNQPLLLGYASLPFLMPDPNSSSVVDSGGLGFLTKFHQCPNMSSPPVVSSSVCETGSDTITLPPPSSGVYEWYSTPSGGSPFFTGNQYLTPVLSNSVTYYVQLTNGTCHSGRTSEVITVNPNPNLSLTGNFGICAGDSTTLVASGAPAYSWSTGNTTNTETFSPSATTTYILRGTSASGCTDSINVIIVVHPVPVVTISGDTELCAGESTSLTASGANSYAWSSGGNSATETLTSASTATYTVTATGAFGCTNSTSVTINVNPLPIVDITGDTSLCAGESTMLTATGGGTYAWSSGGNSAIETVTPAMNSTYSVIATNGNGCSNSDSININVHALPSLSITGDTVLCAGDATTLSASGASLWSWSSGGNSASETLSPGTNAVYSVTGTDLNGCSNSASVAVIVNPLPVPVFVSLPDTMCSNWNAQVLQATPAGGTFIGTSVTDSLFDPSSAGMGLHILSYTYTDTNSCTGTTTDSVWVDICMNTLNLLHTGQFLIMPNPNSGTFTLYCNDMSTPSVIDIGDVSGKIIRHMEIAMGTTQVEIDLSDIADGIYFLSVNGRDTQQIIIAR